jgi:hypothetical protein
MWQEKEFKEKEFKKLKRDLTVMKPLASVGGGFVCG